MPSGRHSRCLPPREAAQAGKRKRAARALLAKGPCLYELPRPKASHPFAVHRTPCLRFVWLVRLRRLGANRWRLLAEQPCRSPRARTAALRTASRKQCLQCASSTRRRGARAPRRRAARPGPDASTRHAGAVAGPARRSTSGDRRAKSRRGVEHAAEQGARRSGCGMRLGWPPRGALTFFCCCRVEYSSTARALAAHLSHLSRPSSSLSSRRSL